MEDPFMVCMGRTVFVWRRSQIARPSHSWNKGHIASVCAIPRRSEWDIVADIRYLNGQVQGVRFSIMGGNQIMTCSETGNKMKWTHNERDVGEVNLCSSAIESIPRLENEYQRRHVQSLASNDCMLEALEVRVQLLERSISQTKQTEQNHSTIEDGASHKRVMQHLRGKLEMVLERSVQAAVGLEENTACIRNDVLKCSVDCSLGEYRDLCLAMKRDRFAACTFLPQAFGEDSTVTVFAYTSINFLSYGDVCAAIGECEEENLIRSIMKIRRRRTRSTPSMIRVIGDALIPHPDSAEPLYITIGSCLSEETVMLTKRSVPVILRQNMVQDEIDMGFVNELETLTLGVERARGLVVLRKRNGYETEEEDKRKRCVAPLKGQLRGFQLRWLPHRGQGNVHKLFEDRSQTLKGVGHLEVVLPTVFCYNTSQCEELLAVCTDVYLRKCIQRLSSGF